MRPIVIFATLLAIACDTPPIEGPPGPAGPKGDTGAVGPAGPPGGSTVKSGTRLKARVARSEDGASQFLGWWDSELDTRCTFSFADPAEPAPCVPVTTNPALRTLPQARFADTDCSIPITSTTPQNRREGVLFCPTFENEDPPQGRRVFPLGAIVSTAYARDGDDCVEANDRPEWGLIYHRCGDLPEVPPSSFASFREHLDD